MYKLFAIAFCVLISLKFNSAHDEDVHTIKLTSENFDEEISNHNYFIMFYAPWCGHCQKLAPTWEQLAEMLNIKDSKVKIAKVDCTEEDTVCSKQDVTGYPTLKFFKIGKSAEKFRQIRDLPTLTNFINEQMSGDSSDDDDNEVILPPITNGLVELTEENFDGHVSSGKHFIKFYAPWCGHCQTLAPKWEELAKSLEYDKSVSIGKVDCTQYKSICNQFEVKGYPTLLWIEDGKKVDKYQGARSHESLKEYVNKMLGSDESSDEKEDKPEKPSDSTDSAVGNLTGDDFEHAIENGIAFVKFFAPWCGHCKRLAPTWDDLGKKFLGNGGVKIFKVDCTLETNKDLCNDQKVEGFPTLYLYKNGEKQSEYSGSRSLEDLYDYVTKHVSHDEL